MPSRLFARVATVVALSLASGCSSMMFAAVNVPAHFSGVRSRLDIPYGPGDRQRLDIYAPAAAAKLPVVVFWYGGSWSMGRKADYRFVGTALAEQGYVVVLPDYRLFPEVRFPAFVDDGARAVAWVQSHVGEFGGDPTRVVLMGHSAGAHEAALLALNPQYLEAAGGNPGGIVGLVGLSGPYVLKPNTDTLNTIFAAPYTPADWQPARFVSRKSPPTLILHGLDDTVVSVEQARQLHDALAKRGVHVEMELYPDRGHAATVAGFSVFARRHTRTFERTLGFLRAVTAPSGHNSAVAAVVVGPAVAVGHSQP
jgi:acetyl esterase/lipase